MVDSILALTVVLLVVLLCVCAAQLLLVWRRKPVPHEDLAPRFQTLGQAVERTERAVRDEVGKNRDELASAQHRQFMSVIEQLARMKDSNELRLDAVRATVEERLHSLQADNTHKLEQMRATVDEKLQGTLERRLGESFQLVSDRLEQVHRGLGEMQSLAAGVGDLKRVLSNVKTRGTWGEVQLGRLLEEVLVPDQYMENVATKEGNERVEFGIRLPGQGCAPDDVVLLPVDAKFPIEDYHRLALAQERGDVAGVEAAARELESRIESCAADIARKYINPPVTTDFALLFLPTEGLFAEVVRRPGLTERLQRKHRVVVAGPTTLWAILSSLQMGFRTLAIQKRSSEVWGVLAAVKSELAKYGDVLAKVQKKLQEASNTVDGVAVRSRAIQRKLADVEEMPLAKPASASALLDHPETEEGQDAALG